MNENKRVNVASFALEVATALTLGFTVWAGLQKPTLFIASFFLLIGLFFLCATHLNWHWTGPTRPPANRTNTLIAYLPVLGLSVLMIATEFYGFHL